MLGVTLHRAVVLAACALGVATSCRGTTAPPAPQESAQRAAPAVPAVAATASADPSRLPEDPVAGKQSEQQWREHMAFEERERQMGFDRERLKEHRAVLELLVAARAGYDGARTEAQVEKMRADMPRRLAEVRRRVTEIDHWGNNSRLLPEYDALTESFSGAYADAKIAALHGDATALDAIRAGCDRRVHTIEEWLEEVNETEAE